eukprot:gb/GECG01001136.1/.p1 GENE.gb/GECG01001136.1/~~gb/GECG01001136.1/.p1  ORF type:complete len:149 (+),score=8.87 gb/GECG01001136.1/:1-447(+)
MANYDAYSGYGGAPAPLRDPQKPLKSVAETMGSGGTGLQIPFGGDIRALPPQGYDILDPDDERFIAFKNIMPRTRLQKRQMQDKESLEKARLREVCPTGTVIGGLSTGLLHLPVCSVEGRTTNTQIQGRSLHPMIKMRMLSSVNQNDF